ncbi:Multidrug resistance-associated protein 5 (ATP-binding cassette sub-family C member 5) (Multi-specific organic anion transporter C) (MOAT-C) (SMRP) (pABC11) [Durusdinium trenchii]|uniref:Multidrug resistance-associated protein 5 (ATP-binding cassette sub-family C member 5) (Multi-specific organic anion transporter C) (MOAT-C) (SMRP) (PABC11) n=1 Tax=Durusdinium trenchii TaxID=1381693 RepID=A0ABP0HKM9_9DINO
MFRSVPALFRGRANKTRPGEHAGEEEEEEEDGWQGAVKENAAGSVVFNGVEIRQGEGKDVEHLSVFARVFLTWITSIIRVGYRKRQVDTEDLWKLRSVDNPEMLAAELKRRLETYRNPEDGKFRPYALWRVTFCMFWVDFLYSGFMELAFSALRFAGPILLRLLVLSLEEGDAQSVRGYMFALGLFLTQALSTVCQTHSRFHAVTIGLRLKNALSLAVFKQVLVLDQEGRQASSNGQIMNLLSTDAQVPVELMRMFNRFWTAPLVLIAGIAYIYVYVGVSVFFGVLLMSLFVPITIQFGKVQTRLQRKKMVETDNRVKMVSEMMLGIKVLKLNAWEKPLLKVLNGVRDMEMKAIRTLHYYRGITLPFALAIPNIASVVTFGAYILMGNEVTPADTFAVVSAFVIIRSPFVTLPLSITMLSRAFVSARRFTDFFELSTVRDDGEADAGWPRRLTKGSNPSFRFGDPETTDDQYGNDDDDFADGSGRAATSQISQASVDSKGDERDVVVRVEDLGDAGQASRIHTYDNTTKYAVVAQNASFTWTLNLAADTISDKEAFRLEHLNFRVRRGELVGIIGRVADGKSSLCSALLNEMRPISGSVELHGSLALCTQEPFIMNRTVRENILFESDFDSKRYNDALHACALAADLEMLPASDLTEIGERGINVSGGQKARIGLARAVFADRDIYILDDPLSAVDAHVGKHIFNKCISNKPGSALRGKTRLFVTNQLHLLKQMDRIFLMEDGRIVEQGTFANIMKRGASTIKEIEAKYALPDDDLGDKDDSSDGESGAKEVKEIAPVIVSQDTESEDRAKAKGMLVKQETRQEGQIKSSVGIFLSIDTWLALYSQQETGEMSDREFLVVYFAITLGFFVTLMARALVYAAFSILACRTLYHRLQNNVFFLPMGFFWETPLGRVLNRLSKDTNDIDVMLPQQMQWLVMTLVRVLGVLVVISFTVPVFMIAIVPFLVMYYAIREYYRRTSVSVQRVESILRSPVYSHLTETVQGVSTLKAFGRSQQWLQVASTLIGLNHRAFFAVESIQVWLSMRLEFLGALIVFVTALCVVATDAEPGLAGLAIAYGLNIVINLNMSVQMATQVEAKLNAVERVIEYSSLENEKQIESSPPPDNWPSQGLIEFCNVSLRYRQDLDPAIVDVSFAVQPGKRVGIAGKTGSGKSTILVAIFRLTSLSQGSILIDGVDIAKISLERLRLAITCIPQDPVLFTSTLRKNLDPFDAYTDDEIWAAIDQAHLRKTVDDLPDGLASQISEGGENLSLGQRQLCCIARAVLRKSKLVMLDEATASIDSETDVLIQQSIRTCFPDCTLLVIAHRLDTILDLDMALVMDRGRIAEFDEIPTLLADPRSHLSGLVKASSSSS